MISIAHAQETSLNAVGSAAGFSSTDLMTIIGTVINVFLGLLGVIFLILTIYAGYLWMTSQGNEETVTKAKDILKSAVIGLFICLAAYAITAFIINALLAATSGDGTSTETDTGIEAFSDSLGSGGITDHYPGRNASDIPRNTRILVTFKNAIYIPSFIDGYDVGSDASDVADDTAPDPAYLNTGSFDLTCVDQDGVSTTYGSSDITVAFTEDWKSFVFDPPVLGSAVATTDCTVTLDSGILTAAGGEAITENYEWSFEVSTELDTTPPTIESIVPDNGDSGYGRNITEQITFSEGVDPTTSTGTYVEDTGGFTKIQTLTDANDEDGNYEPVAGTYETSSGYTIVEFTPTDACGTNSCGETIYCLPGPDSAEADAGTEEEVRITILSSTLGDAPPEADTPYDGVVDLAGNSLDGNADGTAGDDYENHEYTITDEVVLVPPGVTSVSPSVLGEEVALDEDVVIVWDTLMRASSMTNEFVSLLSNPDHDMWYRSSVVSLDEDGAAVSVSGLSADHSQLTIPHGTFLESSVDDISTAEVETTVTYLYAPILPDDIESLYQNCFYPASGPGETSGSTCSGSANEPNCCNGTTSIDGFDQTNFNCQL
ncbi:MAG: Ig-like domain-containing protein [Patescibacteria group bacterium]